MKRGLVEKIFNGMFCSCNKEWGLCLRIFVERFIEYIVKWKCRMENNLCCELLFIKEKEILIYVVIFLY